MNSKNSPLARIRSVDVLRGAVMVLMAIDHVRVYAGIPAGGPTPGIFFTRWTTHFCAPSFVFLAGASAFLYGRKLNDKPKLAKYLITRGLLLVLLELTLVRFGWTFNWDYSGFVLAGVIWMLGWCMVLLSALIWFKPGTVEIIGIVIIFLQQFFSYIPKILPASFANYWEFIYTSGAEGPPGMAILYVLVSWIGVMAAGFGFGPILLTEPGKRKKICIWTGLSAILLFLVIGIITLPSGEMPFIFRLLNQNKYPASPLFLLMTLGPLITLIPFAEKARGWWANALEIFGKVPFFYYILHIPIIHLSALLVNLLLNGQTDPTWYASAPFANVPPEYKWGLPLLYLVFLVDVIILYFICRWYVKYKFAHPEVKWLKYL